jgi:GNAT superfamily N-acetyltransferase
VIEIELRIILQMLSIRRATPEDAALLCAMVRELAEFERGLDQVRASEADLLRDGFGSQPKFRALIAEWNGDVAGYALFFGFYSTWAGRSGIFLEDLFVRGQFRNQKIGTRLLAEVSRIAVAENCYGVRWEVLDWNEGAIKLYASLGATFLDDRKAVVLTGDSLRLLTERVAEPPE